MDEIYFLELYIHIRKFILSGEKRHLKFPTVLGIIYREEKKSSEYRIKDKGRISKNPEISLPRPLSLSNENDKNVPVGTAFPLNVYTLSMDKERNVSDLS